MQAPMGDSGKKIKGFPVKKKSATKIKGKVKTHTRKRGRLGGIEKGETVHTFKPFMM